MIFNSFFYWQNNFFGKLIRDCNFVTIWFYYVILFVIIQQYFTKFISIYYFISINFSIHLSQNIVLIKSVPVHINSHYLIVIPISIYYHFICWILPFLYPNLLGFGLFHKVLWLMDWVKSKIDLKIQKN